MAVHQRAEAGWAVDVADAAVGTGWFQPTADQVLAASCHLIAALAHFQPLAYIVDSAIWGRASRLVEFPKMSTACSANKCSSGVNALQFLTAIGSSPD